MEEYDKILQLVRSDDTNNRLLGFQLAKGQGWDMRDLITLLGEIPNNTLGVGVERIIGNYVLSWKYYTNRKGWSFATKNNGTVEHIAFLTNDTIQNDKNAFEDTKMNFKKLFINLITE